MYRIIISVFIALSLAVFFLIACEETTTEPGIYSVNLNVTVPAGDDDFSDMVGNTASLYIYQSETAVAAIYSGNADVTSTGFSIEITEIDEAEYFMLLVIDSDGTPASGSVMERGDIIWASMDVDVNGALTINLDKSYLQRYHSVMVGVRGYASANVGDLVACALMEDGASYWNLNDNIEWGSYQKLYNQTAVFALSPIGSSDTGVDDSLQYQAWMNEELATDDYDLFFLVDEDGTIDDYEDDDELNPLSPGDLYYEYGFDYDASEAADMYTYLTATFAEIQFSDITLTVNYTIPDDEVAHVTGDTIALSIWSNPGDENPVSETEQVVSGATGSLALDSIPEGTYAITVTIGDEDEGSLEVQEEFIAWAGLDVEISDDLSIGIGDSMWQYVDGDLVIGVRGIDSQYEGEFVLLALFADAGDYYNFHNFENFIMAGYGYVFNNACVIVPHNNNEQDSEFELAPGNYDLVALIDTNGSPDYYDGINLDSVGMWSPYEAGDPFDIIDISYDTTDSNGDLQIYTGSFSNMLAVSGAVTCSAWTSGGGDIYILSFDSNPFEDDSSSGDNDPLAFDILSQPGAYEFPVFPNFSGYVVGMWDVNDSGLDEGPDAGDYIGFYGDSMDSLTQVQVLSSDVDNIDIVIEFEYSED